LGVGVEPASLWAGRLLGTTSYIKNIYYVTVHIGGAIIGPSNPKINKLSSKLNFIIQSFKL